MDKIYKSLKLKDIPPLNCMAPIQRALPLLLFFYCWITFFNSASAQTVYYFTDFDSGAGGWTTGNLPETSMGFQSISSNWSVAARENINGSNNYGIPHSGDLGAENSFIMSPSIPLNADKVTIQFDSYNNNETGFPIEYDVEWIEYSLDGGNWTAIHGNFLPLHESSGLKHFIFSDTFPLSSTIQFRFRFDTGDDFFGGDGWYIDNVLVSDGVLSLTPTITKVSCPGDSDGAFTITARGGEAPYGGTSPYEYSIDNGTTYLTTNTYTNLNFGTYLVKVKDSFGNESLTHEVVVGSEDNIAPTVVTQNLTIQLSADGTASLTASQINNGSSDNCSIPEDGYSLDKTSFGCADVGTNTVTLTVTDSNGNSATETATVTVEDKIAPSVVTKNITVQLNENGTATITTVDVDNGSADACGFTLSLDKSSFGCTEVGTNTVTLTATDNNGNTSSATATVTVEDNVAPLVITRNITVQLNASGIATITAADINNGSSDACGIKSLTIDRSSFDCSAVSTPQTVTLTATDNNDQASSATATVTVEDNIAPVVITRNITVQLNENGTATITTADIDNESSDACGFTLSLDKSSFTCESMGANTITLTVTDSNGNSSTATAIVTVEDKIAPVISVQDVNLVLDSDGQAILTEAVAVVSKIDNCGAPIVSFSQTNFSCENIGSSSLITITATDASGNFTEKTINVSVLDEIAPTAIAQNVALSLDANGAAVLSAAAVDAGSADNCTIAGVSIDKTDFSCNDLGENSITLTVTDGAGNIATATAIITVVDEMAPVVEACPEDVTVRIKVSETYMVPDFTNRLNASDNCSVEEIVQIPAAGTELSELGIYEVQLKVQDKTGNETICRFNIILIHQNTAPHGLTLSGSVIEEHQPEGTYIGSFSTEDEDETDVHTYMLVSGDGSDDNASFYLDGNEIYSAFAFDYELKKTYTIRVAATDEDGELFEKSFNIQITDIEDARVYMPNLFSPNDDGNNDFFRLRASGVEKIQFRVFNRWGVMVYETSNVQEATEKGWDGKYKGKEQPTGTYVWQISGRFMDGEAVLFEGKSTGNITLIR